MNGDLEPATIINHCEGNYLGGRVCTRFLHVHETRLINISFRAHTSSECEFCIDF